MRIPALICPETLLRAGLFFMVIATFMAAAHARADMDVTVDNRFTEQSLGLGLAYRIETGARATPQEVLQADDWIISEQDALSFGFAPEPRWIRFGLDNVTSTSQDLLIEIPYPYLDYIDIYIFAADGNLVRHVQLGDHLAATERLILHANFLTPVSLPPQTRHEVLVRVSTTSTNRIPITIWNHDHYVSKDYTRTLAQALLYGFLLAVSGYHLLLYTSLKEKAYLLWSLSIFGMLCIVLSLDGVATALLWPSLTWPSDYLILLGICGTVGASALFSEVVLNLSETPRLIWVTKGLLVLSVMIGAASFVGPYQLILKLALVLALLNVAGQTIIYLVRMFQGYEPARYVVAAIVAVCGGVLMNILTVSGTIPNSALGANAAAIGVALSSVLYSLALSNRMKLERTLREQAQFQLTRDLDHKVRERSEELKHANEQLLHASITDGLTGLYNRRHFDDIYHAEYRRAYRQKQPVAVLMMDIDHFKKLNDTYGHPFGDLCIETVAKNIIGCLNRPPDICARYGGEEFVVVLPNTDLEGATHVGELINRKIAKLNISDGQQSANISISIGVAAEIPANPDSNEALMKQADNHLYKAKERGRDCVVSE
jgi:diguanylate cyclase